MCVCFQVIIIGLVFFSVAIITFLYAGILAFGFLFLFQQLELGIFLVLRRHLI
jgi:hypothetical protein